MDDCAFVVGDPAHGIVQGDFEEGWVQHGRAVQVDIINTSGASA